MDIKLVCEPITLKDNKEWLEKEIGICIPFGRKSLITNRERANVITQIREYIQKKSLTLTSLRFTNLEGGEPSYNRLSAVLQRQDEKIWSQIYGLWPQLIRKLTGAGDICYLNAYNIQTSNFRDHLPSEYTGRIIKSPEPEMPVLIECTESFFKMAKKKPNEILKRSGIWYYNTLGYILPKNNEYKLKEWVEALESTSAIVKDFFETINCYFEVKYEMEGVWIISQKLDWRAIHKLVEVEKMNEALRTAG